MSAKLFVIIPGFGGPHYEKKIQILQNNISILQSSDWSQLDIRVCVYDEAIMSYVPMELINHPNITWIHKRGIVGQFIHEFATPELVSLYDYILIILDDIELYPSVDFKKIVATDKILKMDIYSPCMTLDSKFQFKYMLHIPDQPPSIKITPACEAFCYFMRSDVYPSYWKHIDPQRNPWIWGLDMCLLKCLGLRACIFNHMEMKHWYKNECYHMRPDSNPCDGYNSVIEKFGVTSEELADQPAILYWIFPPMN